MPDLGIFGLEYENNIVIFEINTLELVLLQNFAEKQKYLNLGPKMPYLGILTKNTLFFCFWARILKSYCHI